ncbi:hypothetical protein [Streptomyces sp. SID14515]|uniref:hypothetical protein n=1 Tax=Streptomyces sp. SID14515 TaxID=2706074 RepID=UPI0013C98579|nr:hypothetical protein [Streptomyces sp. SID14515]NEB37968.1 hypothetical protein [Streptomyces sp. SID14515]
MIQAVLATDDVTFHRTIRATLQATGQVTVAPWHSPDSLLPCVAVHRPDVILLDARSGRAEPLRNQLYVLRELALHQAFAVFVEPDDRAIAEVARSNGAAHVLTAGDNRRQLMRTVTLVAEGGRADRDPRSTVASCENSVRQS